MSRQRDSARLVLFAYPRSFRREFGDDFSQSIADMRRYGGMSRAGLLARVVLDVVRTAPRMRLESLMNRYKLPVIVAVLSVGVFAAAVGSPMVLLLIGSAGALFGLLARSDDRPIATDPANTAVWYRWMIGGVVMFAVGLVSVTIDGPDLTTIGWAAWVLSWAAAAVLMVFGAVLAVAKVTHRTV